MLSARYMSLKKRAGTMRRHQEVKNLKRRSSALRIVNEAGACELQEGNHALVMGSAVQWYSGRKVT